MAPTPEAAPRRALRVGPAAAGLRLDRFLQGEAPDLSRTRLQALIRAGRVTVDDRPAKASLRLRAGSAVGLEVPAPEALALVPEAIPLDVVYEDGHLLVLQINDLLSPADQGAGVARQEMLILADADDQRTAETGGDDHVGVARRDGHLWQYQLSYLHDFTNRMWNPRKSMPSAPPFRSTIRVFSGCKLSLRA